MSMRLYACNECDATWTMAEEPSHCPDCGLAFVRVTARSKARLGVTAGGRR